MKTLLMLVLPVLFTFAACGAAEAEVKNPLPGNWSEVLPGDKHGMSIEFSEDGSKIMVHGRTHEDGSHGHPEATFEFDEKTMMLTVKGELIDGNKTDTWTGKVEGDAFTLTGGDTKLAFKKGGEPQGH